jgi:hypothetical protein
LKPVDYFLFFSFSSHGQLCRKQRYPKSLCYIRQQSRTHLEVGRSRNTKKVPMMYPAITYYWTGLLILDHVYLIGNLTNSKIAKTKSSEPLKFWHFCMSYFRTCRFPNEIWVVQD